MDPWVVPPLRCPTDTPLAKELDAFLRHYHGNSDNYSNSTTAAAGNDENDDVPATPLLPLPEECHTDLQRLAEQRTAVRQVLSQDHAAAANQTDVLWTYARLLRAFAQQGWAIALRQNYQKEKKKQHASWGDSLSSMEHLTVNGSLPTDAAQNSNTTNNRHHHTAPPVVLSLAWQSTPVGGPSLTGPPPPTEDCMLWEWEQANLWWNLAVLEAYQGHILATETAQAAATSSASSSKPPPGSVWRRVAGHFTTAATWMTYLQQEYFGASALSNQQPTQYLWSCGEGGDNLSWEALQLRQALWTATAQRMSIAVFNQPLLKAKFAAAASLLYQDVMCLLDQLPADDDNHPHRNNGGDGSDDADAKDDWPRACRRYVQMWLPFCQALAHAQQAAAHLTRQEHRLAFRRYRRAIELGEVCQAGLSSVAHDAVASQVQGILGPVLPEWHDKCTAMLEEIPSLSNVALDEASLPAIPPQKATKLDLGQILSRIEKAYQEPLDPPVFANLLSADLRSQICSFQAQMDTLLRTQVRRAEEKAESGRRALAIHNLPHALAVYQQSSGNVNSNGGLPDALWVKIAALQQSNKLNLLQQELWELKDMADMTQQTYQKIHSLMDEDLVMDRDFRKEHPQYSGHNVENVQKRYREALQNYHTLMETASKSDAQLLQRLEELPTDTRFKLLTKSKGQLDCLLPASTTGSAHQAVVDVTPLSQALASLSELFRERDELVQELTTAVEHFNVTDFLQDIVHEKSPEQATAALQHIFQSVQESLQDMVQDIQQNMSRQTNLVKKALDENVKFVKARDELERNRSGASSVRTSRTLVMIHQAIEDVEELSRYLEEGKAFYNVVLPKLQRMLANVEDTSTRLTVARCEYEDRAHISRQEAEDAQFAASFSDLPTGETTANESSTGQAMDRPASTDSLLESPNGAVGSSSAGQSTPAVSSPPANSTVRREPSDEFQVDDAKVAHLVGMDFDPERAVAALVKHQNDLEAALNELLKI